MEDAAESAAVEAMLGFDGGGHADDDDDDDAEGALVSMSGGGVTAMPKQKTCRYDSSLGLLTKKFVTLIQTAPEGILDLNQARHEPCPRAPRISRGTPQRAALPEHTAAARAFPRN